MFFKMCYLVLFLVSFLIGEVRAAVPVEKETLSITSPWVRPAKASQNTAIYMTLISGESDRLMKAECEAAEYVELHNNIEENGIMKMRPVQSIDIQGQPVEMKPGGLHIMLFKLTKELPVGEKIPVSLTFEKAGKVDLLVEVRRS